MSKLSISQAWDETKAVLARDGKLIAPVALALLVLPGVLINLFLPTPSTSGMPAAGLWTVIVFAALIVTFVGQLSIVRLSMRPHVTVGEAIAHASRRVLPFLGAAVMWILPFLIFGSLFVASARTDPAHPPPGAALGLLVCTCVGVFAFIRFFLIGPIASAEKIGPLTILRRSWELTSGNWWRLFGFFILFLVGCLTLVWSVGAVLGLIVRLTLGVLTPMSAGGLVVIIILQTLTAAIYAVFFVMQARLYVQRANPAEGPAGVPNTGI